MLNGTYSGGWPRAVGFTEFDPVLPTGFLHCSNMGFRFFAGRAGRLIVKVFVLFSNAHPGVMYGVPRGRYALMLLFLTGTAGRHVAVDVHEPTFEVGAVRYGL